jgi:hypothetical protein
MAHNETALTTVATVSTELEAALLIDLLAEQGITATQTGGLTAQFRAEAPGGVEVMVLQDQQAAARAIIAENEALNAQYQSAVQDAEYTTSLRKFGYWTLIIGNAFALLILLVLAL